MIVDPASDQENPMVVKVYHPTPSMSGIIQHNVRVDSILTVLDPQRRYFGAQILQRGKNYVRMRKQWTDLYNINMTPQERGVVLREFSNLIMAVCLLVHNRWVHLDIKRENIMIRKPPQQPVLIDFDLMTRFSDLVSVLSHYQQRQLFYCVWPPEVFTSKLFLSNLPSVFPSINKTAYHQIILPQLLSISSASDMQQVMTNAYRLLPHEVADFIQAYVRGAQRTRFGDVRSIDPSKIDVYSLGRVAFELFYHVKPSTLGITHYQMILLQQLIVDMTCPTPSLRCTIEEAYHRWNDILRTH